VKVYIKEIQLFVVVGLLLWPAECVLAGTYTTTFGGSGENPISESGYWINGKTVGLDWSDCAITNHMVFGAQTDAGPDGNSVNDSTAILTGAWGPTQSVSGTVYFDRSGTLNNNYVEIELRLRSSISAHSCTGYEINYSANVLPFRSGYIYIVRWNGPFNDFTGIGNGGIVSTQVDLHTGDVIGATINNATIRAYINGTNFLTAIDSNPFTDGSPGLGFDLWGDFSQRVNYGFTSFTATDGPTIAQRVTLVPLFANGQISFSFETALNQTYIIEQNTDLAITNWSTVATCLGTGSTYHFGTPANDARSAFFRVRVP
jgi:hypothetical protein